MSTSCTLYDQFDRPLSGSRLVNASRQTTTRPNIAIPGEQAFKKLVNQQDWRTLSHISTIIYANYGVLRGAISQKAMFAIGESWHPVFGGEAREWGDVATKWLLEQWYPFHDVLGPNRDFQDGLYMDSIEIDRGGDAWILLTEGESGWPLVQRIRPAQIGQRGYGPNTKVEKGDYTGLSIQYGVITNSFGRPVAYRILGETPDLDRDVSARDLIQIYDPEYYDQLRGLPISSFCLEDIQDAITSQAWERITMMIASSLSLIENNDLGAPDTDDAANHISGRGIQPVSGSAPNVVIESFMGGIIRYFKSNSGGKLEQFQNHRPGAEWESHQDRIVRNALAGINWPYSWVWKKDGTNGTATRADQNQAQTSVADRQSLLRYPANRMVGYAISKAINIGAIPPYPGSDLGGFLKWGFTMPPLASIDPGRDGQNRREDWKMGITNLRTITSEMGLQWQDVRQQSEVEAEDLITRAQAVADRTGKPFDTVLVLMRQTTGNANAPGGRFGSEFQPEPGPQPKENEDE
jgi:hypothetical protein